MPKLSLGNILDINGTIYEIKEKIGRGCFGIVYRAESNRGFVAIKEISAANKMERERADRELQMLKILSKFPSCHKYILCYIDHVFMNDFLYLVTELIDGETLESYFKKLIFLNEKSVLKILYRITKGLYYIHSKEITYRDIQLPNIMINPQNLDIRLIDFGISYIMDETFYLSKEDAIRFDHVRLRNILHELIKKLSNGDVKIKLIELMGRIDQEQFKITEEILKEIYIISKNIK